MLRVRDHLGCSARGRFVAGCAEVVLEIRRPKPQAVRNAKALPRPQRTYLFKDVYKEFIIKSPKKVGYLDPKEPTFLRTYVKNS